jgi:hypothetical protein
MLRHEAVGIREIRIHRGWGWMGHMVAPKVGCPKMISLGTRCGASGSEKANFSQFGELSCLELLAKTALLRIFMILHFFLVFVCTVSSSPSESNIEGTSGAFSMSHDIMAPNLASYCSQISQGAIKTQLKEGSGWRTPNVTC